MVISWRPVVIKCDEPGCPNEFEGDDDAKASMNQAREEGWKIEKDSMGNYVHTCPTCVVE